MTYRWNNTDRESKIVEKTLSCVSLSNTNPNWTHLGENTGLRDEKSALTAYATARSKWMLKKK
jgi:hypothetical protein